VSQETSTPAVSVVASEMATRVRDFDWASTPLGPISEWPNALRIAVGICLNSRFPMFVWWGPQLINVYNDGYIPMLGARHPHALGRPAQHIWHEIWDVVGAQARIVMERGEATFNNRAPLTLERHGYPEETYFTWSYSPILDEAGRIAGLFCAVSEETATVFAERDRERLLAQVEHERARLAEAFAQAPSFLAVLRGPEHLFEYVNPQYQALLGNRPLVGRAAREAVPEVADQGFFEILDRVYRTGEPFVGRAVSVRLQRDPRGPLADVYLDFVYQPMRDADGRVVGILAHGVDVTEHQQSQQRDRFLLSLEEAIRSRSDATEIINLAALMLGAHLRVARCAYAIVTDDTQGFHVVGEFTDGAQSALGRYRFSDYRSDLPTRLQADEPYVLDDVSAEAGLGDREYFLGRQIAAIMAVPLHKDGKLVAFIAVTSSQPRTWQGVEVQLLRHAANRCWEATQRVRAERRLRESLEAEQAARGDAERASRMKDEFLATLSHELRTPLNAILGWAHMLRRPEMGAREVQRGAEVIERNARAQSTIIEDLLDMSAIVSGKVRLQMQSIDMAAAVRGAIDSVRPTAEAKQVMLELEETGVNASVTGDPHRLQQVLWNLLTNAIKFTPRGGRIAVSLRTDPTQACVIVSDNGEGIPADFLPYLFDRFRQADASTTRRHGGLGLGLSIVKHLVELHGGTIRAESDGIGLGARFTIVLPIAGAVPAPIDPRHVERRASGVSLPTAEDTALITGKRILVVDDDVDARELVRRLLEDCGARVVIAGSSAEALERLQVERFDVLVSDIGMPVEDGHALMRKVRALPPEKNGDIPAVALTAYARAEDRVTAIRAGFQMHAAKPVEPTELLAMVATLVRKRVVPA
jgi:signal transduction histidine kinase/ActR/RegA family two-component response regulator